MFKLFYRQWPATQLAILDITRDANAKRRTDKYLTKHGFDVKNWHVCRHYELHTTDLEVAQALMNEVKTRLKHENRRLFEHAAGQPIEVFKVNPQGLHWVVYRVLQENGYYQRESVGIYA